MSQFMRRSIRHVLYAATTIFIPANVLAVPVVPNFSQGQLTSRTESRVVTSETIVSEDFSTGWEYTVSGQNVKPSSNNITAPAVDAGSITVNGITTTWKGLDLNNKPTWSIVEPGASFMFAETYSGAGLRNRTTVTRTVEADTIVESTSVFSQ